MRIFLLTLLLTLPFASHSSSFVPQAFVDLYDLSKYIVGPLDAKKQKNSFIKGFMFGSATTLQQRYVPYPQPQRGLLPPHEKILCYNLAAYLPITFSTLDLVKNHNSFCFISRIIGFTAGHITIKKFLS